MSLRRLFVQHYIATALPLLILQGGALPGYTQEELHQRLKEIRSLEENALERELIVGLFLDKRHVVDILALVRADDTLSSVRYRDLKKFLGDLIRADVMDALGEQQDLRGWLEVDALAAYLPEYDDETYTLHLTTPVKDRTGGRIDLQPRWPVDYSKALYPSAAAGYVNLFHQFSHEAASLRYRLVAEGAFFLKKWVAEGRLNLSLGDDAPMVYDNLRLIRDYSKKQTRLVIGETQSFSPRILTGDRIQGVRYGTEYDLYPRFSNEPLSEFSFLLQRDSTVEVWLNGQYFETLRLRAGPYDVFNFPLRLGLNNVTLKLRDDLGREQVLHFQAIKGPNLLKPGHQEYTASLGVKGQGTTWSDDVVASGYLRRGVSDTVTASCESRLDREHWGVGAGLDFATPWFFGVFEAGATLTNAGLGSATHLTLSRHFDRFVASFRSDINQKKFLTQSQEIGSEHVKFLNQIDITVPNYKKRGTFYIQLNRLSRWNGDSENKEEVRWSRDFGRNWHLLVKANHRHGRQEEWLVGGELTYNYYGKKYRHRHDLQFNSDQSRLRSMIGNNNRKRNTDWIVTHDHSLHGEGSNTLAGSYRYRHNRFTALYRGEVGQFGDANEFEQTLNLHTALAWVDGAWAIGQPISDSFAIVEAEAALGDVSMDVYSSGVFTEGTSKMGVLVHNLKAYEPSHVNIETYRDDSILEPQPYLLIPEYKSGFRLTVKNEEGDGGILTATGTLLMHDQHPFPFQAMFLTNEVDPDAEPFVAFTNGEGKFVLRGLSLDTSYFVRVGSLGQPADSPNSPQYKIKIGAAHDTREKLQLGMLEPINEPVAPKSNRVLPRPRVEEKKKSLVPTVLEKVEKEKPSIVPLSLDSASKPPRAETFNARYHLASLEVPEMIPPPERQATSEVPLTDEKQRKVIKDDLFKKRFERFKSDCQRVYQQMK